MMQDISTACEEYYKGVNILIAQPQTEENIHRMSQEMSLLKEKFRVSVTRLVVSDKK